MINVESKKKKTGWKYIIITAGLLALGVGVIVALGVATNKASVKAEKKLIKSIRSLHAKVETWKSEPYERPPFQGLVEGNAGDEYRKIFEDSVDMYTDDEWRIASRGKWKGDSWTWMIPYLDKAEKYIPDFERAQKMKTVDWEIDYHLGSGMTYGELTKGWRKWIKLLDGMRKRAIAGGDRQKVKELTLIMARFAMDIDRQKGMTPFMMKNTGLMMCLDFDNADFGQWNFDAETWESFASDMDNMLGERTSFTELFENEKTFAGWSWCVFLPKELLADALGEEKAGKLDIAENAESKNPLSTLTFHSNLVEMNRKFDEFIELLKSKPGIRDVEKWYDEFDTEYANAKIFSNRTLAGLMFPNAGKIFEKDITAEARFRVFRTAAALMIHKEKQSSLPGSLAKILQSAKPSDEILTDPFDGKPLRYRLSPDGKSATIWSIGPDLIDESGKVKFKKRNMDWTGDIVIEFSLRGK